MMESLHPVSATDPTAIMGIALLFIVVALAANYVRAGLGAFIRNCFP